MNILEEQADYLLNGNILEESKSTKPPFSVVDFNNIPNPKGFMELTLSEAKTLGGIQKFGNEATLETILLKLNTVANSWQKLNGKKPKGL